MEGEYVVTEEVKKLRKNEMGIYLFFKEFCKAHGLRYSAVGGTTFGAVRHNGFILRDDDIDFAVPHEDYQIFLVRM